MPHCDVLKGAPPPRLWPGWLQVPARQLEPEVMQTRAEVEAYDTLTLQFLDVLHAGFVETVVNASPSSGRFLEVGCGTGWVSIGVAKACSADVRIVAIDLSENMLAVAKRNAQREGVADRIAFRSGDAKALPFGDREFDAVYCHNMLHHVPDASRVLREAGRVVRDDGSVWVRDLVRQKGWIVPFHVHVFGARYNALMKAEYDASIRASFSTEEWECLCREANIPGLRTSPSWWTHQDMARPSSRRRPDRRVASTRTWLAARLKRLYVGAG